MRYLDGCPECVGDGIPPADVEMLERSVRCWYRCPECGHRWWTSYLDDAAGRVAHVVGFGHQPGVSS
jgi:hypothetical protein